MSSILHVLKPSNFYCTTMSSWKSDPFEVSDWRERPKCHCVFRMILCVWTDRLPRDKYKCRYFTCPDLDDDFMVTTITKSFISHYRLSTWFMTSTSTHVALQVHWMGGSGAADMATLTPNGGGKQRTILCQDDSGLWVRTTDVAWARAAIEGVSNPSEGQDGWACKEAGAVKSTWSNQEEEFQAREATLKNKSDRKKGAAEQSSRCLSKGKQPRYTQ